MGIWIPTYKRKGWFIKHFLFVASRQLAACNLRAFWSKSKPKANRSVWNKISNCLDTHVDSRLSANVKAEAEEAFIKSANSRKLRSLKNATRMTEIKLSRVSQLHRNVTRFATVAHNLHRIKTNWKFYSCFSFHETLWVIKVGI